MARHTEIKSEDAKIQALQESGSLNRQPQNVGDALFCESEFFDPRDLVMVKYEMLRRVRVEGMSVAQAARTFGFTRPVFYQAQAALQAQGLAGLIRKRPGPKGAHKLSDDVLDFVDGLLAEAPTLRWDALAKRVLERFGRSVHSRSIERALAGRKKGRPTR